MRTFLLLVATGLGGCESYSPIREECSFPAETVAMDDDSLGVSANEVAASVGDHLAYTVTWEPVEGLEPLPTSLTIQFAPPSAAAITRPTEIVEGGCPPEPNDHLRVVTPYSLALGDAAVGEGESALVAFGWERIELHLDPTAVSVSEPVQASALAWLKAERPTIQSITDYRLTGLFDLSSPTLVLEASWEGTGPTTSGASALWRSASLSPN